MSLEYISISEATDALSRMASFSASLRDAERSTESPLFKVVDVNDSLSLFPAPPRPGVTSFPVDFSKCIISGKAPLLEGEHVPRVTPRRYDIQRSLLTHALGIDLHPDLMLLDQQNRIPRGHISMETFENLAGENALVHVRAMMSDGDRFQGLPWMIENGQTVAKVPAKLDMLSTNALFDTGHTYPNGNTWDNINTNNLSADDGTNLLANHNLLVNALLGTDSADGWVDAPGHDDGVKGGHGNNINEVQFIISSDLATVFHKLAKADHMESSDGDYHPNLFKNEPGRPLNFVVMPGMPATTVLINRRRPGYSGILLARAGRAPAVKYLDPNTGEHYADRWISTWTWLVAPRSCLDLYLVTPA